MDLKEVGCEGVNLIHLAQDRSQWQALWTYWWTFRFHKSREFLDQLNYFHSLKWTSFQVFHVHYITTFRNLLLQLTTLLISGRYVSWLYYCVVAQC